MRNSGAAGDPGNSENGLEQRGGYLRARPIPIGGFEKQRKRRANVFEKIQIDREIKINNGSLAGTRLGSGIRLLSGDSGFHERCFGLRSCDVGLSVALCFVS